MSTTILENLQHVCKILNEHAVEYLTIGGSAVALHGYQRVSRDSSGNFARVDDLDFWYSPTYGNYWKLLNAIEKLGHDVSEFRAEQAPDPKKSFFRYQHPEYTLDFLPEVPGLLRFRAAFIQRGTTNLNGVEIPFINLKMLIRNKQYLNRQKDQEDILQLKMKEDKPKPSKRPGQRPH